MDTYSDFKTLAEHETLELDYRIRVQNLKSNLTIAAIHGGSIEPKTSSIAEFIAGTTYNSYCFEGIKETNNIDLHITSHRFDEPTVLELISSSEFVNTVHACSDRQPIVYIGGLCRELASLIQDSLADLSIETGYRMKFSGTHPHNICNRGTRKQGVQLEFSRGLRDNPESLITASQAIRIALDSFTG